MARMRAAALVAVLVQATAWVLPGTSPTQYLDGVKVELKVIPRCGLHRWRRRLWAAVRGVPSIDAKWKRHHQRVWKVVYVFILC